MYVGNITPWFLNMLSVHVLIECCIIKWSVTKCKHCQNQQHKVEVCAVRGIHKNGVSFLFHSSAPGNQNPY